MTAEIRTLCDIFLSAAASGKPDLLSSKVGNAWTPISARDFGYTVRALSLGLNALGVQPGDRVAILSENRPEWAMADYAILCAGGWTVPIYPTLPAQQIVPLLKDSGAKAVFVSNLEQLGKVMQVKAQCPAIDHVISVDAAPPGEPGFLTFHALVDKGRPTLEMSPGVFEQRAARVKPEDVATIIYTSGTTGDPKGVMLTHGNFVSNVRSACRSCRSPKTRRRLSFLPLSHVFERTARLRLPLPRGVDRVRGVDRQAEGQLHRGAPALLRRRAARLREGLRTDPGPRAGGERSKRKLFRWAVARRKGAGGLRAARGEGAGGRSPARRSSPTSSSSRRSAARSAPASASPSRAARRSPGISRSSSRRGRRDLRGLRPDRDVARSSPSTGRAAPGSAPWAGRSPASRSASPHDGEILTRGPHVMKGYYNKPEATAEAIDADGWFHTGDIGHLDEDGFLMITDRKKDLIVLAGGKKIAPQPIESELKRSAFVELPIVLGDRHKFLAALIVPNFETAPRAGRGGEAGRSTGNGWTRTRRSAASSRARSTPTTWTRRTTNRSGPSRCSPRT